MPDPKHSSNPRPSQPQRRTEAVIRAYRETGASTDPLGMYTGIPEEVRMNTDPPSLTYPRIDPADPSPYAKRYKALTEAERRAMKPVQDADDL